jgi:hypothetical protein
VNLCAFDGYAVSDGPRNSIGYASYLLLELNLATIAFQAFLSPLSLVSPVFCNFLGGLMEPVLVSRQPDHLDRRKPFRSIRGRIAERRQLATASKICILLSVKPRSFAVLTRLLRAGKSLVTQVAIF